MNLWSLCISQCVAGYVKECSRRFKPTKGVGLPASNSAGVLPEDSRRAVRETALWRKLGGNWPTSSPSPHVPQRSAAEFGASLSHKQLREVIFTL